MKRGRFIVFEGIDGCGKSTQILNTVNHIVNENKYNHVVITREPYQKREIREILRNDSDAYSQADKLTDLFVRDRKEHIQDVISPALEKGIDVISDRFKLSTIVYQSIQGMNTDELIKMHLNMPIPDLTLVFDVPASVAVERMRKENRDNKHKFEADQEFLEKLRQKYLEMPKLLPEEKIIIIDATKPIEEIKQEILKILSETLNL